MTLALPAGEEAASLHSPAAERGTVGMREARRGW